MKFSVVTPTLNNLDKLRRCVGSVRGQREVQVEHIIQDAQSSDGTVPWLRNQADLLWRSEVDSGMYQAINRGWSLANGEILSWLNSDEQYLPGTLERVAAYFSAHPDVDFLYGDALVIRDDGSVIAARREIRLSTRYIANSFLNAFSCTTFFRRRLYDQGLLHLDERYRYASDMDLVLRLLKSGAKFAKIDAYLAAFTMDGSNLSCHDEMLKETADIQSQHGGCASALMRQIVVFGRYIERLLTGSYRAVNVEYAFCIDEKPTYRYIVSRRVPGSYRTR